MPGEITFFELGVKDAQAGRAFYEGLFGWEFAPGPGGDASVIRGSNVGGGIHGGDPGSAPYVFFAVDDIEAAANRIVELGGTIKDIDVEGDADSIAKFGRFKLCEDDQGSPFGIHQRP